MFAEQYRKIFELYQAHEKSIADITKSHSKQLNTKIEKLSTQVNTNSDNLKELSRKTKDLQESLIVDQDLRDKTVASLEKEILKN